ncbi:carboxypeptidase-like regulatory domain-containing protein [Parapedobacter soli]|uniref:carboxypeptidase-like regulatory domain-containing protein n=1 Tax=Parapedobacter soli TaxID=416955 RepID=UPI0021C5F3EB|nr:carboxypeptidase-like regulatory domain-containing protein [Parapedobacter soli]
MIRTIKLLCCALFICCQSIHLHAQQDSISINTVVEKTQKLLEAYPIEKVHIHFDKPYYSVGDTMWFKVYLTSNMYNYELSKVAYVEVMNGKDSLMQTMRIPLTDHAGDGHLVLDQEWYTQGNYRFRAYTKWMVNFDPAYFFNKIIPIGDVLNNNLHYTVSFNDVSNGKNARTQAVIQFKDREGKPLGDRKLTWAAVAGWEPIDDGKGKTDAVGNVVININGKDRDLLRKGNLHVSLESVGSGDPMLGSFPLRSALWDADVQFFPEGGDLLAGVAKKVAFKAVGNDGRGLSVTGSIVDQGGNEVAKIGDSHFGMGYFMLTPEAGNSYMAKLSFENGQSREYPLPAVAGQGINVTVLKSDTAQLQLAIVADNRYFNSNKGKAFYLIAQSNGILCYAAQALLRNEAILVNLPKDRFPTGIAQLTLFSSSGKPLSERLVFVENIEPLDITVTSNKNEYAAKELVNLGLAVANNGTPTVGNYSISVVDETKVPFDGNHETTILSNLLLTSDLKGYVEAPNYYFTDPDDEKRDALDALLLTQGYRRFSYSDVLADNYPPVHFFPEQGIEISGILRLNNGKPVVNGGLLLSIPDRSFRTDVYTDERGHFVFKDLQFTDSSRVTINARGNDNYRNMVINVDPSQFPGIDTSAYRANDVLNIDERLASYLDNSRNEYRTSVLLEEVEVTATVRPTMSHKDYPAISGLGMADHQLSGDRLKGCNNLIMCLQTALTGITYDAQSQLFYITRDYNSGGRIPVQFFVNGMAMDVPGLNGVMPSDVEGIEIFLRDELGTVSRMYQNNGVVSIYTKKVEKAPRMSLSEIESLLPKSNIIDLTPLGYVKERKFYVPKYDTPERRAVNDIRTTVYWNPDVKTGEDGRVQLDYYNSDGKGSYRVVVEGVDMHGNIGRAVYRYTVN